MHDDAMGPGPRARGHGMTGRGTDVAAAAAVVVVVVHLLSIFAAVVLYSSTRANVACGYR